MPVPTASCSPATANPTISGSPRSAPTAGSFPPPYRPRRTGVTLAPAERADLLVDFSDLDAGTELTLWNTATVPFYRSFAPVAAGTVDLEGLLPYPEVLRIRVRDGRRAG